MGQYNDDHQLANPEAVSETNGGYCEPDWNFISARLGEAWEDATTEDRQRLALAVCALFDWMLAVRLNNKNSLNSIGKRVVAAAWVINPERFGDDASLRKLSKEFGFSAANIAPLTAEFSKLFKIANDRQKHDWRSKK